jgi:hypothetical protein
MREPERHAVRAQPLREARQVDHQRRVRERQIAQIDDHVTGRDEGRGEGPAAAAAGGPVLIPLNAEDRELCVEGDDVLDPTTNRPVRTGHKRGLPYTRYR